MDKRFQVFLSSTYADLKEERRLVMQTLMKMDCIPAGMELFPATDEEQWAFIQKIIDDCDYYLLIVGGRYGSVTSEGISYTEKEFDYAVKKGLKVVALIHEEPGNIPLDKSEKNPKLRKRLTKFVNKVKNGRLVELWKNPQDLPGLVALSMLKTIKTYPATGWVRADRIANESILAEINQLRKENRELQKMIAEYDLNKRYSVENIADFDSDFIIHYSTEQFFSSNFEKKIKTSWRKIFSLIAPFLVEYPDDDRVKNILGSSLKKLSNRGGLDDVYIDQQDFKTVTIQLKAYGLVKNEYSQAKNGKRMLFWSLTPKGEQLMMENRIIYQNTPDTPFESVENKMMIDL